MNYLLLKHVHMALAAVSIGGFILRWAWRMRQSHLASVFAVRIVPHVVDTIFLATAVALGMLSPGGALGTAWFCSKTGGLLLYIGLGMLAMHTAPRSARSLPAFIAALAVFAWIVSVARSKNPLGVFAYLIH